MCRGWNTLAHIIWVEQPVGTGFSTGNITARSEENVAAQFNGFWKNFVDSRSSPSVLKHAANIK
jgi:carboxypeptidase D